MSAELAKLELVELAARIRARELSAVEAVEAALARFEKLQPTLNAAIALTPERALDAARGIDARLARGDAVGPLAGVPLAHKDMYYRAGRVSSCGARIRRQFVPDETATVLERLDAAGAIDLGGLNMAEFAVGPLGHNRHFGDIRNPWDPERAPGGSSSGSGAAVAARLAWGALGSDTGGSIRLPAAFCGVVGLKPTYGRVSRHAILPLSFSLDCAGPLARTVRDAARLLGAIAGADPRDPTASDRAVDDYEAACGREIKGLRLARPTSYFTDGLDPQVAQALDAAARAFEQLGAEIVEVELPEHGPINALWNVVMSAEAATLHRRWLVERPGDYQEQVRRRIELGLYLPATRYVEALSLRAAQTRAWGQAAFARADAVLTPTVPFPAPTLAETDVGDADEMPELILRVSGFTRPVSYLGLPALSLPCGFSSGGLPLAMQLIGRPFDETTLCALGHAYQEATEWHRRVPALAA